MSKRFTGLTRVVGFFISGSVFYVLNLVYPVRDMGQMDDVDIYGTFTETEARRIGVAPLEEAVGKSTDNVVIVEDGKAV